MSASEQDRLLANVNAGLAVKELLEFVEDIKQQFSKKQWNETHFWETLALQACARCGRELAPLVPTFEIKPMDEKEAIKFEREKVMFGKHAGRTVGEITGDDPDYWVVITSSDFNKKLTRYLKSKRFLDTK